MKFFILIFSLFLCQPTFSQCSNNYGKEFYVSFLINGKLSITSKVNTTGTIINPNTGYLANFSVLANEFTIIDIPSNESANFVFNTTTNKGLIVKSIAPIAISSNNGPIALSDIALIYPLEKLGTEYLAMAWGRNFLTNNFNFPPSALIVATENNTLIEIKPTAELSSNQVANVPFTIILNKAQTYVVAGKEDITGTSIKVLNGNKPIAVYCGQRGSIIPIGFPSAEHLFEQAVPNSKLGKSFITPILKGRGKSFIKITSANDSTVVKINGTYITTINNQQVYQLLTNNTAKFIETSNPVEVGLFGASYTYDSLLTKNIGDPTFMFVQPMHQFIKEVFFETPKLDSIKFHKLCVIVQTASKNSTFLNGINIGNLFTAVSGNVNYSMATLDLNIGKYLLSNNNGVIAYLNGYGHRQAYGYSAGAGLNELYNKTNFECKNIKSDDTITVRVCKDENIFKINALQNNDGYQWDFGDGSDLVITNGSTLTQSHSFEQLGNYVVSLSIKNCNQTIEKRKLKVLVYEPFLMFNPKDTLIGKGNSIILYPIVQSGIVNYNWTPNYEISSTIIKQPLVTPLITTKYSLTITDTIGCKRTNDFTVKIYNGLNMPSAFTPNNDNVNDVFRIPVSSYIQLKKFSIYNRWGQQVFETTNIANGWNGTISGVLQETGNFVWLISYVDIYNNEVVERGSFILIK